MEWEERLRERASQQHGLVARFHLDELGCSARQWQLARTSDRWDAVSRRVLALRGAPSSVEQRALAAVLDASPGAVLHEASALAWFGIGAFDLKSLQIARPRGISGKTSHLSTVRRLRTIRSHHIAVVRGVPTERPLRAIWAHAAKYASEARFELGLEKIGRLLDQAHRKHLVTWAELHEMIDDIHQRGRSGTVIMRDLGRSRLPGTSATESRLEEQFEAVLRAAGMSVPRRQIHLGGLDQIGRCDFSYDDLPLAIEIHSETFHTTPSDVAADERRYRALNDAGFAIAVVWEHDLWRRQSAVVDTVKRARIAAEAHRRVVLHSPGNPLTLVSAA